MYRSHRPVRHSGRPGLAVLTAARRLPASVEQASRLAAAVADRAAVRPLTAGARRRRSAGAVAPDLRFGGADRGRQAARRQAAWHWAPAVQAVPAPWLRVASWPLVAAVAVAVLVPDAAVAPAEAWVVALRREELPVQPSVAVPRTGVGAAARQDEAP